MQLTLTADGSHTLELTDLGEHYHSTEGAIEEARHVYMRPCLLAAFDRFADTDQLHIFEMGFGTGLNALLSSLVAQQLHRKVLYTSVELHPVSSDIYSRLNYAEQLHLPPDSLNILHEAPWNETVAISPWFSLCKCYADICSYEFPLQPFFHAVFYDAFAPQYQPSLWSASLFGRMAPALHDGALLTTYCCKGDVKRALRAAGFLVEKLPGFGRKREMLRATMVREQ